MGKIAFMFSGQGAQYTGMGKDISDLPDAAEVFKTADKSLGFSISDICFNESDKLNITEFTQPAILTTSIALFVELKKHITPDAVLGLSLGEYSALVACNALGFVDAVKLVNKRGKLMTEAVPTGVGTMAAIIGLSLDEVAKTIQDIDGVYISNHNCPKQYVIGGYKESVNKAMIALKEAGARRTVELNVSGPFHTPLLKHAARKLSSEFDKVNFKHNDIPIVMNFTGEYLEGNLKSLLTSQVMGSVRFEESIKLLEADGFDTFIEVGPGRVLSGFVKKVNKTFTILNVEDKASLEATLLKMGEQND